MAKITIGKVKGDSAYEIAVKNGFSGTEDEWLRSLKGRDGAAGPQGPANPNASSVNGLKFWKGTQSQYDQLPTKDDNTIYLIK